MDAFDIWKNRGRSIFDSESLRRIKEVNSLSIKPGVIAFLERCLQLEVKEG